MGENSQIGINAGKKPRITYDEDNGKDIISGLPESIISRILSILPTKDAVRTCVLSKNWEYKWTYIYKIKISDRQRILLKNTRKTSFVSFVDRIFILSQHSSFKRFYLWCHYKYDSHRIISWISGAIMRNVKDLRILYDEEGVVLPRCLSGCKSLTRLHLQSPFIFRVSAQNIFSSLKMLHLAKTKFLGEAVPSTGRMIFDFPVLESLELLNCEWLKVKFVEIHSPALTRLCVTHYLILPEPDKYQIKISGAKIAKLENYCHFVENLDLVESSVLSAVLDFHCYPDDVQVTRKNGLQARFLLKGFSGSLNHLKLSGEAVEAITKSDQGPPPEFIKMKRLEVFTTCKSGTLLEFLQVMPLLESIVLYVYHWEDYDYDAVEHVPTCLVFHLTEIRFSRFSKRLPDYRLADFFLSNASKLKKISGLCRETPVERQKKKMLGLLGDEYEEKKIDDFWGKWKSVLRQKKTL